MEQRSKRLYSIVFIFFSLCLTILLINIICSITHEKITYKKITYINPDLTSLEEEYEFYNNIDKKILDEKEDYFNNIRKLEDKINNGESDKKIAYLTFDDGPYKLTYTVLDI